MFMLIGIVCGLVICVLFQPFEDKQCVLFQPFEDIEMFNLIGIVCGLAIYNFTIIDLHFPQALFKKLLNRYCFALDLHMCTHLFTNARTHART